MLQYYHTALLVSEHCDVTGETRCDVGSCLMWFRSALLCDGWWHCVNFDVVWHSVVQCGSGVQCVGWCGYCVGHLRVVWTCGDD